MATSNHLQVRLSHIFHLSSFVGVPCKRSYIIWVFNDQRAWEGTRHQPWKQAQLASRHADDNAQPKEVTSVWCGPESKTINIKTTV